MPRKTEFHSVEFFRKVRDRQASVLAGKSPAEIVAFFSKVQARTPIKGRHRTRQKAIKTPQRPPTNRPRGDRNGM